MKSERNGINSSSTICCDASLLFRLLTGQQSQETAVRWQQWRDEQREFVAPQLLRYEVTNALFQFQRRKHIDEKQAAEAMRALIEMQIQLIADADVHLDALELATAHSLPAAYDAHYLAVALREGTELWTADRRLYNSVNHRLNWVRLTE